MPDYNVTVSMSGTPNTVTGQYNVKSYGAVGDGTTDDATPIQTCFSAAAAAGGGVIIFPPDGDYLMDSQIALTSADNITISADGAKVTCGTATSVGMFQFNLCDNLRIRGLEIDGDNLAQWGIDFKGCSGTLLEGMWVHDMEDQVVGNSAVGLRFGNYAGTGGENITINNCWIEDIDGPLNTVARGILFYTYASTGDVLLQDITISNCHINRISPADDGDGIVFQQTKSDASAPDESINATVIGCVFNNCYKRAIKVQNRGVTIVGNSITTDIVGTYAASAWTGNMWAGIGIQENDCVCAGNVLTATGGAAFQRGITVGFGGNVSVTGNTILNSTDASGEAEDPWEEADGIVVEDSSDHTENVTVSGNSISNTERGIYVAYNVDNVAIVGNSIMNSGSRDIFIYTPADPGDTISNLTIAGNAMNSTGANIGETLLLVNPHIDIPSLRYTGGVYHLVGSTTPEENNAAPIGSTFVSTGGGSGTTLYVKESGAGTNTGWVGK